MATARIDQPTSMHLGREMRARRDRGHRLYHLAFETGAGQGLGIADEGTQNAARRDEHAV